MSAKLCKRKRGDTTAANREDREIKTIRNRVCAQTRSLAKRGHIDRFEKNRNGGIIYIKTRPKPFPCKMTIKLKSAWRKNRFDVFPVPPLLFCPRHFAPPFRPCYFAPAISLPLFRTRHFAPAISPPPSPPPLSPPRFPPRYFAPAILPPPFRPRHFVPAISSLLFRPAILPCYFAPLFCPAILPCYFASPIPRKQDDKKSKRKSFRIRLNRTSTEKAARKF